MADPWRKLPPPFIEKLFALYPDADRRMCVLDSFSVTRPTTFRVNRLKTTPESLAGELAAAGIRAEPVPWLDGAYILKDTSLKRLAETAPYTEGRLYVQSLSSMVPPVALAPQPGERVLDIAAAPGSKTTQMAAMMGNDGQIVANDNSRIRIFKLNANLAQQGVTMATVTNLPGQGIWQRYPERFDRTLVDVPCSMEGRFDTADPTSFEFWTPAKVKELAERQKWMLRSAVSATKPGGTIVYSTCTLSPEENEGVVDWILRKEAGKLETVPIDIPGLPAAAPLTTWKDKPYHNGVANTLRIDPSPIMEGFFIAKFVKTATSVPKAAL